MARRVRRSARATGSTSLRMAARTSAGLAVFTAMRKRHSPFKRAIGYGAGPSTSERSTFRACARSVRRRFSRRDWFCGR